jgi:hypothetical protein
MEKGKYNFEEKPEWNMTANFLLRLNDLFIMKSEASIKLDFTTWFLVLEAIVRDIHWKMIKVDSTDKVEKYIADKQKEIRERVSKLESVSGTYNVVYEKLSELDTLISDLVQKYGFIYPEKDEIDVETKMETEF